MAERSKVANLVHQAGGYMDFIDYENTYKDDNKEFLRGDMWQLQWTPPRIVYWPGDEIINARLNSVNVAINYGVTGIQKRFRGNFTISQQTGQDTSGTLTLSFIDREDQAITYFATDWRNKIAEPDTKYSFRKDDLVSDKITMIYTNSSRVGVRSIDFYNCILLDSPLDENGADVDGTDRADIQMSLFFEHHRRSFDNI